MPSPPLPPPEPRAARRPRHHWLPRSPPRELPQDDEKKLAHVYGLRMGQEIDGGLIGPDDSFKGYVCVGARARGVARHRALAAARRSARARPRPRAPSPCAPPLSVCSFRVSGGNDKQGFPMMQGVLSSGRV